MGKSEKTGLGRALVKHHNQMVQQSKEKGHFYRSQHRKVLESYTEISDIDAILEAIPDHDEDEDEDDDPLRPSSAAAAASPNLPIKLDASPTDGLTPEEARKLREMEEKAHRGSLRVPRRPPWHAGMSVEELDANERQAFLAWRRVLAGLEENDNLILTSFEKNLDIWRQLWRVLERSDLLVMVVDARDPLFYRCPDLEEYAREIDEHKRTLLLVNKADLLPFSIRRKWAEYFNQNDILYLFWSAKAVTAALEGKKLSTTLEDQDAPQMTDDLDTKIYGREELLARLQWEAEQIVIKKTGSINSGANDSQFHGGNSSSSVRKHVVVGFVGYPNVGKSSTINALVGQKRTGVTSTPGKTKHFQTLIISEELTLCDCPGLVFPSFSSSRYEMMASGVLPIDRMTQNREAVQVVANRVPRHVIESVYNISLPKPKPYEPQSRPPLAAELLRAYCASRGYVASSGLPDETRAARLILKDYIDGKLPHYEIPPPIFGGEEIVEDVAGPSLAESQDSDSYDPEVLKERGNEDAPALVDVLDNLSSFDMENGLASKKEPAVRKQNSSYKQHKKPQRKKDRSWRTGNDGGDGTPVVRVFQKPVNTGPLKN